MSKELSLKPSRFNLTTELPSGGAVMYNAVTEALSFIDQPTLSAFKSLIDNPNSAAPENLERLVESGHLVPSSLDEMKVADAIHNEIIHHRNRLELIILPTEKCNFRCEYCYEDFLKGPINEKLREAIKRYIDQSVSEIDNLSISWFGGEPLTALRVIEDLSSHAINVCEENDVQYSGNITTNAYLLDDRRLSSCIRNRIQQFQITLDGPKEIHDKQRPTVAGHKTFDRILLNLENMKASTYDFHVRLRVNFASGAEAYLREFVNFLGDRFGDDSRFSLGFHAVGHWGGANDANVDICDKPTADLLQVNALSWALDAGFQLNSLRESMKRFGSVCYAANPRSFVIGSDGTVYKCTVAFDDARNQVGRLMPDGNMQLDDEKVRLWTHSGEDSDQGCRKCAFRPACQGNLCPWERMLSSQKVCPSVKQDPSPYLSLLAKEALSSKAHSSSSTE